MKKIIICCLINLFAFSINSYSQDLVGSSLYLTHKGDKDIQNYWPRAHLNYPGHNLVIGSVKGAYSHNVIKLEPGGSAIGEIYSQLEIYHAKNENDKVLKICLASANHSFINNGANFGIGTSTPKSTLDVAGTIRAKEVKIEVDAGADFVFAEDYNLVPLSEVENFIKKNKHLPEIPSEKQMLDSGINVVEIQIKLLQKIEELTLYTIDNSSLFFTPF